MWRFEFDRIVQERSPLRASSEGLAGADRRDWSAREVAMVMTISASDERAARLLTVADRMVAKAQALETASAQAGAVGPRQRSDDVSFTTLVHNWAATLDRSRYSLETVDGLVRVGYDPPSEIQEALAPGNQDLQRGQQVTRLVWRYSMQPRSDSAVSEPITAEEIAADFETVRDLIENPPVQSAHGVLDAATALASVAIREHVLASMDLPPDVLEFAANTIVETAEWTAEHREFDAELEHFEDGRDRLAADALPLFLIPRAEGFLPPIDVGIGTFRHRVLDALRGLALAGPNETRLHLARALDPVWAEPCALDDCHHHTAFSLIRALLQDSVLGDWDPETQQRQYVPFGEPMIETIAAVSPDNLVVIRLDAPIRALGAASTAADCVKADSRALLDVLVESQRRALLSNERSDYRGGCTMVTARALLGLAAAGDRTPLLQHLDVIAENGSLLERFLRALAAAAEENQEAANEAAKIWPSVMHQVLDLIDAGRCPIAPGRFGRDVVAALLPEPTVDGLFWYREVETTPIKWNLPAVWQDTVERWLPVAAGSPRCVDSLVRELRSMEATDQVRLGLSWVEILVSADIPAVVNGSYLIAGWLIDVRASAEELDLLGAWQRLVDSLVVAGSSTLAPFSE